MKNAIHTALAAALVATAVIGGASAAFAGGSYYEGVSDKPINMQRVSRTGNGTAAHYGRNGAIDRTATGSVSSYASQPKQIQGGEGEYYQGLSR